MIPFCFSFLFVFLILSHYSGDSFCLVMQPDCKVITVGAGQQRAAPTKRGEPSRQGTGGWFAEKVCCQAGAQKGRTCKKKFAMATFGPPPE